MRRTPLWIGLLCACSQEPPLPVEDPAVQRVRALAGAGDKTILLCGVVDRWAGSPEAQVAAGRVAAAFAKARTTVPLETQRRRTRPVVRELVDAALVAGAADPCRHMVAVHVTREISHGPAMAEPPVDSSMPQGELIRFAAGWYDNASVAESIKTGLGELTGGWLYAVTSVDGPPGAPTLPTLHVRVEVLPAGFMHTQGGRPYLAFELHASASLHVPGEPAPRPAQHLGVQRLPASFAIYYSAVGSATPPSSSQVADKMVQILSEAFRPALPRMLGLAPPNPAFDPFAGRWTLSGTARSDGCGGDVVLAARNADVDAVGATLSADVVDRVYAARIEADALVADGRFVAAGACEGTSIWERWTLRRQPDGSLAGLLASTWQLEPDCASPCTVRFDITARPAAR